MPLPFFRPSSRPGQTQKPILKKPVAKPKPEPKPGIFGEKQYRSFREFREFARKAPYEKIPTYGKRLGKKERLDFIKTLQKYSGQSHGLSDKKFDLVVKRMTKEKIQAGYKKDYKKIRELDQKIKQFKKWRKG
ncbi:hypothetical protein ES703_06163 [subsurface metagenome]